MTTSIIPPISETATPGAAPPYDAQRATLLRFALQRAARSLVPGERVAACMRWQIPGQKVELWSIPEHKRARYGGLQVCSSQVMCPVCAAKISEKKRVDLRVAVMEWRARGGVVVMATYTMRHGPSDPLRWLTEGLMEARNYAGSGGVMSSLRRSCGVVGTIRNLEITQGDKSGWHPHIHELIFVESASCLGPIVRTLRKRWACGVERAGMGLVNEHGFSWTIRDDDIAEYIAKYDREPRWALDREMTKQHVKKGREGRRTPNDLLAACAFGVDGDGVVLDWEERKRMGELWREYAFAIKGRPLLRWSNGLRLLLGLGKEKTDEQLNTEADALGVYLGSLEDREWQLVLAHDMRAELLNVAAGCSVTASEDGAYSVDFGPVRAFLASLETPEEALPVVKTRLRLRDRAKEDRISAWQDTRKGREQIDVYNTHDVGYRDWGEASGLSYAEWSDYRALGVEAVAHSG